MRRDYGPDDPGPIRGMVFGVVAAAWFWTMIVGVAFIVDAMTN